MNEHTRNQAAFFAAVFVVAFLASFGRLIRDGEFISWRRSLAFSATSGSLSFGLVAIFCDYPGGDNISIVGWLGMSAVLGVFSKEQDAAAKHAIRHIFKVFGIEIKDPPGNS